MTLFEKKLVEFCVSYVLTISKDTIVEDAKNMFPRKQSSKVSDHLAVVFSESTVDITILYTGFHFFSSDLHLAECCFHSASSGVQ